MSQNSKKGLVISTTPRRTSNFLPFLNTEENYDKMRTIIEEVPMEKTYTAEEILEAISTHYQESIFVSDGEGYVHIGAELYKIVSDKQQFIAELLIQLSHWKHE